MSDQTSTDRAYDSIETEESEDRRHSDPDCEGAFRRVWGPTDDVSGPPQALVCSGCGAWRPIERMEGGDD